MGRPGLQHTHAYTTAISPSSDAEVRASADGVGHGNAGASKGMQFHPPMVSEGKDAAVVSGWTDPGQYGRGIRSALSHMPRNGGRGLTAGHWHKSCVETLSTVLP